MIPNTKERELETSGVTASAAFGISQKHAAHIMSILRDQVYSDKVLAVLREYSSNAWDAHREVGKDDLPIHVTIPTSMDPTLKIRDFGPGMSQDDVLTIYTQYGSSTKRENDNVVGMLGIGSKSGFAYSDSFAITSWHGGKKRMYVAVLDQSEAGAINQLHEEDCDTSETGIEIQIAVRPPDILEFVGKARNLFEYFVPRPVINIDLPPEPTAQTKLKHGTLIEEYQGTNGHEWVAVMGCVPYKIDLEQVKAHNNGGVGIAEYLTKISGALYFDIGAVHISSSRESLRYTPMTKKALIDKFSLLIDEFVQHTIKNLEAGGFSLWERRVRAQVLTTLRLPIPDDCKDIVQDYVKLKKLPDTCVISQNLTPITGISIASRCRLILRDTTQTIVGYNLGTGDYLVTTTAPFTEADVQKELLEILKNNGLEGMPITRLSALTWTPPPPKNGGKIKKVNKKHSYATFELIPDGHYYSPYSQAWKLVDREPTKDDVFVIISKFKGNDYAFFKYYHTDCHLAKLFGGKMPTIYGYKTTEKQPIVSGDCMGTDYQVWRKTFHKSLFTPKLAKIFSYWEWSKAVDDNYGKSPNKKSYEAIRNALGAKHEIVQLFKKQQEGKRVTKRMSQETSRGLNTLKELIFDKDRKTEPEVAMAATFKKYPLLEIYDLNVLWAGYSSEWFEYVKLVDNA